jgi:CheY-like chemotaxis protein
MSADELTRLFDPLKGHSPTPHLSLMLGVARNQLRKWGGDLECHSQTEEGGAVDTEWTLTLPRVTVADSVQVEEAVEPAPRVRSVPASRLGASPLILVVDDEPENARMLAEVLTDEGYQVKIAHSGEAALHAWEHHAFDGALLDGLMPDMSGWELARELRARSPDVLLAMITGADIRGQNRANLALVDAVFRKPIDVEALDEFLSRESAPHSLSPGPAPSLH